MFLRRKDPVYTLAREDSVERLHILPVSLLETHRERASEFLELSHALTVPLGWHYILDLAWASQELKQVTEPGSTVLDAGAGVGLMQWWLADCGIDVISVDRMERHFSRQLRSWCPIVEYKTGTTPPLREEAARSMKHVLQSRELHPRQMATYVRDMVIGDPRPAGRGTVRLLEGDLAKLSDVPSDSVDAVVSISSLEHNTPQDLERVVAELMRVLKPGGRLIATLGCAKDEDWYHEASSGWCYTEATLRRIFALPEDCTSNYDEFDALFDSLKSNDYLRVNLSQFYFQSGNNGMPWGRWDPKYQSVGVVKVKA